MKGKSFQKPVIMLACVATLSLLTCGAALAQGGAAWCRCYCGVSLRAPCGDDDCKKACGWRPPSTGAAPGGSGPAAIGSAIGSAISSSITNAINQSREREEQERQRALQGQQQMMQSVDEMARENVRRGDELLQNAAEQARRLDDQNRKEALSALSGMPQGGEEITLKPATDFFGIPANPKSDPFPPVDSSAVDLRHLDPGRPITVDQSVLQTNEPGKSKPGGTRIMDCKAGKVVRGRLAAGLPVQEDAIKKSEALVQAMAKDVAAANAETRRIILQGAIQESKAYAQRVLTSVKALRSQIEMAKGLDKAKRDALIRTVNAIAWGGEDLSQAGGAGYEAGVELQKKVDNLSRHIGTLWDKVVMESGVAEKAGEELAGKLWGPLGELGFRGAKLSIELTVAVGSGIISKAEKETAERNLDVMRRQYREAKGKISELDRDMAELCTAKQEARQ